MNMMAVVFKIRLTILCCIQNKIDNTISLWAPFQLNKLPLANTYITRLTELIHIFELHTHMNYNTTVVTTRTIQQCLDKLALQIQQTIWDEAVLAVLGLHFGER